MKIKNNEPPCASLEKTDTVERLWDSIVRKMDQEITMFTQYLPNTEKGTQKCFRIMDRRNWALCYLKRDIYPLLLPGIDIILCSYFVRRIIQT